MTAETFADKLFANAGAAPASTERQTAVAAYGVGNTQERAAALTATSETGSVYTDSTTRASSSSNTSASSGGTPTTRLTQA